MGFLLVILVPVVLAMAFGWMSLDVVIAMVVAGGIGFAIGNFAGFGWGVFGAILGGLIGISAAKHK